MNGSWRRRAVLLATMLVVGVMGQATIATPGQAAECQTVRTLRVCVGVASVAIYEGSESVVLVSAGLRQTEDGSQFVEVVLKVNGVRLAVAVFVTGEIDNTQICLYDEGAFPDGSCIIVDDYVELPPSP